MKNANINLIQLFSYLPYIILLLVAFTYFYFFGEHIFFYQEKSSLFVLTHEYLVDHLSKPGMLLVYLGKFFSSLYYLPLTGSVITSILILLFVFITSRILNLLTGKKEYLISFLSGCIIFFLHTHYQYFVVNTTGLLLQVLFFYVSINYLKNLREWLIILIFPFWYFLTGSFAFIFLLQFTIYKLAGNDRLKWHKPVILWFTLLVSLFFFSQYIFFQPLTELLIFPYSFITVGYSHVLFLLLFVLVGTLPAASLLKPSFPAITRMAFLYRYSLIPIILITLTGSYCFLRIDNNSRHYFHVEKLFYQNRMQELIDFNIKNPANNRLTSYLTNIALCETGQMNELLFHFPQSTENNTLFLQWERIKEIVKRGGYFYYTIGLTNEAHRWFFEYLVMEGYTPQGLKMLIRTELINGNHTVAARYTDLLKKTFYYKNEAIEFEKLLFNDQAVDSHPELGVKKRDRLQQDFFVATRDPLMNLAQALHVDSLNRQAFEYKLAYLLMKKDFISVVHDLPYLDNFGITKLPAHLQEALAVYRALPDAELSHSGSYTISRETEVRFRKFYETFQQFGNNRAAAEVVLKEQFGNTFWYYVIYY